MAINFNKEQAQKAFPKFYKLQIMVIDTEKTMYNPLEGVEYNLNPGEYLLRGTVGECWPIPAKKLAKYELLDGTPLTEELMAELPRGEWTDIQTRPVAPDTAPTMVIRVPVDIRGEVTIERGDTLKVNRIGVDHGKGDVLCGVDTPWPWVVNGQVFDNTYSIVDD